MNAIKTKAIVEDAIHLKLQNKITSLKKGTLVDLVIISQKPEKEKQWQKALSEIGTYSDEELSEFTEARKEFNKWQPREF